VDQLFSVAKETKTGPFPTFPAFKRLWRLENGIILSWINPEDGRCGIGSLHSQRFLIPFLFIEPKISHQQVIPEFLGFCGSGCDIEGKNI
jgi:hypothetical protein